MFALLLVMLPLHGALSPLGQKYGGASSLLDQLISYWKLDETSDGSAPVTRLDSVTASANDLTDNNLTPSSAGKISLAGNFTRANVEYLSRASNASLAVGDIDFTYTAWVKLNDLSQHVLVGKDSSSPRGPNIRFQAAVRFAMQVFTPSLVQAIANSFGAPSIGVWYFLVGWHDAAGDTVNIQVNDGAVDSVATGGALQGDSGVDFRIGSNLLLYVDGQIDEVGFWKRVLTAGERTQLYNSGNGLSYPF